MRRLYHLDVERMYDEQGALCTVAWGGLFVNFPEGDVYYFDMETGESREVKGGELDSLMLDPVESPSIPWNP